MTLPGYILPVHCSMPPVFLQVLTVHQVSHCRGHQGLSQHAASSFSKDMDKRMERRGEEHVLTSSIKAGKNSEAAIQLKSSDSNVVLLMMANKNLLVN